MSSSSAPPKKTFRLSISGLPADATLTLYDGWDEISWRKTGESSVDLDLTPGLYTLRAELAGLIKETTIRLDRDVSLVHSVTTPLVPEQYTAAPLEGTALSHEYYRYPSSHWSKNDTRPPIDPSRPSDASIFVFIRPRSSGEHPPGKDLAEELFLLNAEGATVSSFSPSEIQSHSQDGWLALSAPAPQGFYSLEYRGTPSRAVALYLFPGWQTQVFILHHQRALIEGMRIFLARVGVGFNPGRDDFTVATDLALDFLQNGITRVPQRIMGQLLQGKFDNPMLGLVAGYVLLRQPIPDESLLTTVTTNLEGLLGPQVPDVHAIRILVAQALKQPLATFSFRYPPMFRAGLEGVIRASLDHPELLPQDGVIDDIATRMLADSLWSSWETSEATVGLVSPESQQTFGTATAGATPKLDWVQSALLDAMSARVRRMQPSRFGLTESVPATSPASESETQPPPRSLTVRQIALKLNLPKRTVETALQGLNSNPTAADEYLEIQGTSDSRSTSFASPVRAVTKWNDLTALLGTDIFKAES
jgi:hypothetical protein